jgi:CheY-like chemotaxis protein
MSAVLGIVRAHDGAIFVESEPGRGTRIEVLFPALEPGTASATAEEAKSAAGAPSLRGGVLVVDDENVVRTLSARMLERVGLTVFTAADGYEALQTFHEHAGEIDCVVLDLTMPLMDGVEVFRALREARRDLPVVLASGYSREDVVSRFGDDRPDGFLHKPFHAVELREEVRRIMTQ